MRRSFRDAFVVGFVVAGMALAVLAFFWLSGRIEGARNRDVVAYFDDVTGLRVGDPVEVLGLPRGKVSSLELENGRVRCVMRLDRNVILTRDTRIAIRSISYLGNDRYLMVTLGQGPAAADTLVFAGVNEALDLEETFLRLDRMMTRLDPGELTGELRRMGERLMDAISGQLDRFTGELAGLNSGIGSAVGELQLLSAKLDSLTGLFDTESSAGRLLTTDEFYQELRQSNSELQALLVDIREHPQRYFKLKLF